jgi:hypothetical protein
MAPKKISTIQNNEYPFFNSNKCIIDYGPKPILLPKGREITIPVIGTIINNYKFKGYKNSYAGIVINEHSNEIYQEISGNSNQRDTSFQALDFLLFFPADGSFSDINLIGQNINNRNNEFKYVDSSSNIAGFKINILESLPEKFPSDMSLNNPNYIELVDSLNSSQNVADISSLSEEIIILLNNIKPTPESDDDKLLIKAVIKLINNNKELTNTAKSIQRSIQIKAKKEQLKNIAIGIDVPQFDTAVSKIKISDLGSTQPESGTTEDISENITVSYNDASGIIIKKGSQDIYIKLDDFYLLDKSNVGKNLHQFKEQQKFIRYIDILKDGTITPEQLKTTGIFKGSIGGTSTSLSKSREDLINHNKDVLHRIETFPWTDTNYADVKMSADYIYQESGLKPDRFIEFNKYGFNIASDIIDPASRTKETSLSDIDRLKFFYFTKNNEITIEKSFFELFGLSGCSLTSKRYDASKNYQFELKIGNVTIKETNYSEYFIGNKKKNKIISILLGKKDPKYTETREKYENADGIIPADDDIIKALLISKELGDVLQILYVLIFKAINKNDNYYLSTCDHNVYLLCQIIGINCNLTNIKDTTSKKTNPGNRSSKYIQRFTAIQNERTLIKELKFVIDNILIENCLFINFLIKLVKNPKDFEQITYKKGKYNITDEFRNKIKVIISDLEKIQTLLRTEKIKVLNEHLIKDYSLVDIEKTVKDITNQRNNFKNKFKFICFIDEVTMTFHDTQFYTMLNDKILLTESYTLENYGSKPIYKIIIDAKVIPDIIPDLPDYDIKIHNEQIDNLREISELDTTDPNFLENLKPLYQIIDENDIGPIANYCVKNMKQLASIAISALIKYRVPPHNGGGINHEKDDVIMLYKGEVNTDYPKYDAISDIGRLNFSNSSAFYYNKNLEPPRQINLYDQLDIEINDILVKYDLSEFFDYYRHLLLYEFEYYNEVFYDDKLEFLICYLTINMAVTIPRVDIEKRLKNDIKYTELFEDINDYIDITEDEINRKNESIERKNAEIIKQNATIIDNFKNGNKDNNDAINKKIIELKNNLVPAEDADMEKITPKQSKRGRGEETVQTNNIIKKLAVEKVEELKEQEEQEEAPMDVEVLAGGSKSNKLKGKNKKKRKTIKHKKPTKTKTTKKPKKTIKLIKYKKPRKTIKHKNGKKDKKDKNGKKKKTKKTRKNKK